MSAINSVLNFNSSSINEFYSPVCKDGYLTPLQRKKLREKRKLNWDVYLEEKPNEPLSKKRLKLVKKDSTLKKKKILLKNKRVKVSIPHVQFNVAQVLHKSSESLKDRKFFKTTSPSRLKRANFTMALVLSSTARRSIFNVDKSSPKIGNFGSKGDTNEALNIDSSNEIPRLDRPLKNCEQPLLSIENKSNIVHSDKLKFTKGLESLKQSPVPYIQEQTIFDFEWPSDEILLERQKKARESVKKSFSIQENVKSNLEESSQSTKNAPLKYYPIFQKYLKLQSKHVENENKTAKMVHRTVKDSSKGDQLIIDAGQKEIGPKVCPTCNMLYTIAQEEDERLHSNYHDMYLVNLKFQGWKEENVIGEYSDGRVLMVKRSDKIVKLKKIEDIITIVNRDLGFSAAGFPAKQDIVFILFISNSKRVVGCIVAESISLAYKVLLAESSSDATNNSDGKVWRIGNWCSSSESVPAVCGINRVWVDKGWRRKKIASRMIDCLRCHFIHGYVVGIQELAFTDPSPDGREFAAAYTGTENFLVYR